MPYNIITWKDGAIRQISNTDFETIANSVLEYMANNSVASAITIGDTNPIGTFTDSVRVSGVGGSNTEILSNIYTLSQINSVQLTTDPPNYVGLEVSGNNTILKENSSSLDDLADEILEVMVQDGPNLYYLANTAPADGDTWESQGIILDTLENFGTTSNTYHLWKKTARTGIGPVVPPIKLEGSHLVKFTNSDIEYIAKKVEERFVSTGIGTYVLQTAAPGVGTWAAQGTIHDTRRTATGASYEGATYQTSYVVDVNYIGPGEVSYYGEYVSSSTLIYTGQTYFGDTAYGGSQFQGFMLFYGPLEEYIDEDAMVNFNGFLGVSSVSYIAGGYSGYDQENFIIRFFGPGGQYVSGSAGYYGWNFLTYFGPPIFYVTEVGYAASFTVEYLGQEFSSPYNSVQPNSGIYTNILSYLADYTADYASTIVNSSIETPSTVTLWKRIA